MLPRDGRMPPEGEQPAGGGGGEEEEADQGPREYVAVLDADSTPMAEQVGAGSAWAGRCCLCMPGQGGCACAGAGAIARRSSIRLPLLGARSVIDAALPQVVLQLILNRAKIRALVRDAAAAKSGFGPYIEAVQGSSDDAAAVRRLLRGAKAAVCCGRLGALLPAAAAARTPHVVLLSAAGGGARGGGLAALFASAEQKELADAAREQQLRASGLPHTIVQVGALAGVPGGESRLALTAGGAPPQGEVSREDAAKALAEAAERDPAAGSLVLQLASAGAGEPPEDWQAVLQQLAQAAAA